MRLYWVFMFRQCPAIGENDLPKGNPSAGEVLTFTDTLGDEQLL